MKMILVACLLAMLAGCDDPNPSYTANAQGYYFDEPTGTCVPVTILGETREYGSLAILVYVRTAKGDEFYVNEKKMWAHCVSKKDQDATGK